MGTTKYIKNINKLLCCNNETTTREQQNDKDNYKTTKRESKLSGIISDNKLYQRTIDNMNKLKRNRSETDEKTTLNKSPKESILRLSKKKFSTIDATSSATEDESHQNGSSFISKEFYKKMPYTSHNFVSANESGSSGACEDITPSPKNCFRLVVLGTARVGKTCLVTRFLGGKFDDCYTPTIEDFHRKLYRIRGEVYQLDILDTSGNHPFPAMRRLSFLTGDLFVIVFSMDSRTSWEEAIHLREQILETKLSAAGSGASGGGIILPGLPGSGRKKSHQRVPMVLAGNKSDAEIRTVNTEEVIEYVNKQGQDSSCVFVECSAKKNLHVDDVFYELFLVANLPLEMAPNHHKRISIGFGAPCSLPPSAPSNPSKKYALSIKRRLSDACGVVTPNVRRPSIRTDLMIMRNKTSKGTSQDGGDPSNLNRQQIWNKCTIQ